MTVARLKPAAVTVATVLITVLASAAPTAAENFSGFSPTNTCDDLVVTNNANYYAQYSNLSSAVTSAVTSTLNNDYAPTDLSIFYTTSSTVADVVYKDFNLTTECGFNFDAPGGPGAYTRCIRLLDFECDLHGVWFDDDDVDGGGATYRAYITCHEAGHTVGLSHKTEPYTGSSCMKFDYVPGNSDLTSHDEAHINAWYPENSG